MEHTLYQRQHGAAHKAGIVGIHFNIHKNIIIKVEVLSPKWQWESIAIESASNIVSKHLVKRTTFSGQEEPTALQRKVAVQGDSGREASTGMITIFLTKIGDGVSYQMVATIVTLRSSIAVAVMVTTKFQWLCQQTSLLSSIAMVITVNMLWECVTLSFT